MSCRGKGYGKNIQSDEYLYAQFGLVTIKSSAACRKIIKTGYPDFNPKIAGLMVDTSIAGKYMEVNIYGYNFLPNQNSFVEFGSFGKVPVLFKSVFHISFIVPSQVLAGTYAIRVVNIYNNNFSPNINNIRSPTNYVYSNSVNYILT